MATRRSSSKPKAPRTAPVARGASLATLTRRAKEGDREALAALLARTADPARDVVVAATKALAKVGTPEALGALAGLALESPSSGCRFVAMRGLDHACKKHPSAIEAVVRLCEDPRVDSEDYPLTLLSNLALNDQELAKDPRVLASLRRALGPSTHIYAQEAAVATLAKLKDRDSLPRIVALLDQKQRGPDLLMFVAKAILELGGGAEELARLRAAKARATRHESVFDAELEKLARRVEGPPSAPRRKAR